MSNKEIIDFLERLVDTLEDGDKVTNDLLPNIKNVVDSLKNETLDVFNNMVFAHLGGKLGVNVGDDVKVNPKDAQEAKEWVKKFMEV